MTSSVRARSLALEVAWAFCMRALGAGSGLIMSFAIARALGVVEAGYFMLALAVITFLSSLCRLGMDNALLRFIASNASNRQWGAVDAIFRQAAIPVFIVSAAVGFMLWAVSPAIADHVFGKPELSATLRAIAPGLLGLSMCYVLAFSLQAMRRIAGSVFAMSLGVAAGTAIISPALSNGSEAGQAYSIISLVTACAVFFWWKRSHPSESGVFPKDELWRSAIPLWIAAGAVAIQQLAGQFVAGGYVEAADVARLAVAQRTSFVISFVLISMNLVVSPKFSALYKQGNTEGLRRTAQASVRIMLVVAIPLGALTLLMADRIMNFFGPGFGEGGVLLQILILGQLINAVTGSVGSLLMMTGHEKDMRNIALVTAPLAIALAFALTPTLGVVGAATATAVGVGTQNLIAVVLVKRRLGFSTMAIWQK